MSNQSKSDKESSNYLNLSSNQNSNRKKLCIPANKEDDYKIYLENIQNDSRTTLMMKNIPNKYSKKQLLDRIDA